MTLCIQVNNRYGALNSPESATIRLFHILSESGEFPIYEAELSVVFVDDRQIAHIHKEFMNRPEPTDVLTFPADTAMAFSGEIIVSVDHARNRATELNEPFSDELSLYLIHGWLHLAGYDDLKENDRFRMRTAEQAALVRLDQANFGRPFRIQ